jgi:hypothetical protein
MPSRLNGSLAFFLAGLLVTTPSTTFAQPYGGPAYGPPPGWWHGDGGYGYHPYAGGYRPWAGYGAYAPYAAPGYYPGYYGYPAYYGHYDDNGAWVAVAGILAAVVGSAIAQGYVYGQPGPVTYAPPVPPPPLAQDCPDGSTIPAGIDCPAPPAPAPAPVPIPPPPAAQPQAEPERG